MVHFSLRVMLSLTILNFLSTDPVNCSISTENLRQHLDNFFSKGRSYKQYKEKVRVRTETKNFLLNLQNNLPENLKDNIEISTHNYTTDDYLDGQNLILTIKGSRWGTKEDEVSLVGAHYDSQNNTPGVDDNGSGMAALLEIARVLVDVVKVQNCNLLNTVIVVAFDHEETGLIGSSMYVQHLASEILDKFSIETFHGAYILETILNFDDTPNSQTVPPGLDLGFPAEYELIKNNNFRGDFLIGISRQDDVELADRFAKQWFELVGGDFNTTEKYRQLNFTIPFSGNPLSWYKQFHDLLIDLFRSDHYSFWTHNSSYTRTGLKAVFITDTAEFRGEMKGCYHNPCDDLAKLTDDKMEFLRIAGESVFRALVSLSIESEDLKCLDSTGVPLTCTWLLMAFMLIFKYEFE